MSEKLCPFCNDNINNARFQRLASKFPDDKRVKFTDSILYQNDDFVVYPELHPAAKEVHTVLIVPRKHHTSFQSIPEKEYDGLKAVLDVVRKKLTYSGDQITWFEHGSGKYSGLNGDGEIVNPGKSIFHAHLHASVNGRYLFKDLKTALMGDFKDQAVNMVEIDNNEVLPKMLAQAALGLPYLYIGEDNGAGMVMVEQNEDIVIPSQFLRKKIADVKKEPFINWKEMNGVEELEMAVRLFDSLLFWSLAN